MVVFIKCLISGLKMKTTMKKTEEKEDDEENKNEDGRRGRRRKRRSLWVTSGGKADFACVVICLHLAVILQ